MEHFFPCTSPFEKGRRPNIESLGLTGYLGVYQGAHPYPVPPAWNQKPYSFSGPSSESAFFHTKFTRFPPFVAHALADNGNRTTRRSTLASPVGLLSPVDISVTRTPGTQSPTKRNHNILTHSRVIVWLFVQKNYRELTNPHIANPSRHSTTKYPHSVV